MNKSSRSSDPKKMNTPVETGTGGIVPDSSANSSLPPKFPIAGNPTIAMTAEISGRKLEIILAAGHILATAGVSGLTIKRLAEEMRFSDAAIYKHFSSKEEIILTMLGYLADAIEGRLNAIEQAKLEPEERFRAQYFFMLNFFHQNPHFVTAAFSDGLLERSQQVNAALVRLVSTVSRFFMPMIKEGQAEGKFIGSIPSADLTHIVMGSIRMLMFKWRLSEFKSDLQGQGTSLFESLSIILKQPKP